jgi:hydrogenase maturation protease
MTADSVARAPVLVLGLGNLLLQDDAVGLRLLADLEAGFCGDPRVEFVDGGTQGLALVGLLADRPAVLMLDAVGRGASPGTVHRIDDAFVRPPGGNAGATGGAHQLNAGDLLLAVQLLGQRPARACVVGIEPAVVRTGIGLSEPVQLAVPAALESARDVLRGLLAAVGPQ